MAKSKKQINPVSSKLYEDLLAILPRSVEIVDVLMQGKWLVAITGQGMRIKIKSK